MLKKKGVLYIFGFLFLLLVLCIIAYQPMISLLQNKNTGILGYIILISVTILQVIFVFLPGEIVEIMAGLLYGSIGGTLACLIGCGIGSIIIYYFTKKFGMYFVSHFIDINKINDVKFLKNKEKRNILCFIVFFIPGTPKDLLTYLIPFTDMKLPTFLLITTLARIPSIITSTMGGHALSEANYLYSLMIFAITGVISIIGLLIYRKMNHQNICHL